jgi:uncharacterized membrane protein YvlD (DUF360 family)
VNPGNPWLRFTVGVVAAAIAIRMIVDLLRPILPILTLLLVALGLFQIVRWWRSRW